MKRRSLRIACLWLLPLALGCARSDTIEVSGAITWQGAPVPHGDITFISADPHIPAAAGKIVAGAYAFRCKPGSKRVEIRSYHLTGKTTSEGVPIGEMYIPAKFNSESALTANVSFDGNNRFDFNMTK
jgi:hypothetical protein